MERTQGYGSLESTIGKLRRLSNESQAAIASIINKLAEAEGVSIGISFKLPIENLSYWLTKLKSERKSVETIYLYEYLVRRFLKQNSKSTKANIREYLARRIEKTSSLSAEMERKALASLFSFL
jgi:hypothetical protein